MPFELRLGLIAIGLLLSACSAMQVANNQEMDKALADGQYRTAALLAESRLGLKPDSKGVLPDLAKAQGSVLNHLEAAEAWRMVGEFERSLAHYDFAEVALQKVELQSLGLQAGKQAGATLLNDTLLDYKPSPAEAVLVNYNKALTFWYQGDLDNARVELNRSEDRIRRAVERYDQEISAAQKETVGKQGGDAVTLGRAEEKLGMSDWAPYSDFVVPQATYLHALFLANSGDPADVSAAQQLLERVAGIEPDNTVVAADLANIKAGSICPSKDCVWFLQDEALGPVLEEVRLDLPVVTHNGLVTVSFAIPKLVSRQPVPPDYVSLSSAGTEIPRYILANMDRVVQSEFKKRAPATITRAVVGATARAIMQSELNKNGGLGGMLLGSIANIALTSADVRSWRSVPGTTKVSMFRKTGNTILLQSMSWSQEIALSGGGNHIVYVREPRFGGVPLVTVLHFDREMAVAAADARRSERDRVTAEAALVRTIDASVTPKSESPDKSEAAGADGTGTVKIIGTP